MPGSALTGRRAPLSAREARRAADPDNSYPEIQYLSSISSRHAVAATAVAAALMMVLTLVWPGPPSVHRDDAAPSTASAREAGPDTTFLVDYGAPADGMSPDSTAWEAALRDTPSGGTLVLPEGGTLVLTRPLTIRKPLRVEGNGSTVVRSSSAATIPTWLTIDSHGVVIENLTFIDSRGTVSGNVIQASGRADLALRGLHIHAPEAVGVRVRDGHRITLEDNVLTGVRGGIYASGPVRDVAVTKNRITGWRDYGVHLYGTADGSPSLVRARHNVVADLRVGGHPRYPIHAAQGVSPVRLSDVEVSDNAVYGPGDPYEAGGGGTADQISMHNVNGLTVRRNVSVDGGDMGITVEDVANVVVEGNVVRGSDAAGVAVFSMATDVTVVDNDLRDNGVDRNGRRPEVSRSGIRVGTSRSGVVPQSVVITRNSLGNTGSEGAQLYGVVSDAGAGVSATHNEDAGNVRALLRGP